MADIFREVDEDLRRENLEKLWKKYGRVVIALAVVVVLAVAGVQGWRAYDQDRRETESDQFATALDLVTSGDAVGGINALADLSDAGGGGYSGLAAFEQARLLADNGDVGGAIKIWDRIAADGALGPGFRDVATLLSVMYQIDEGAPDALRQRLDPLAGPGKAFRASALELQALLALRDGDRAEARDLYTQIVDDVEAPARLRARASQILAALEG